MPPHLISLRSILISSPRLRLGLASGLSTKTLYAPFPSYIRATFPRPSHLMSFQRTCPGLRLTFLLMSFQRTCPGLRLTVLLMSFQRTCPGLRLTVLLMSFQRTCPGLRLTVLLRKTLTFYGEEVSAPQRTFHDGWPTLVGCTRLLIHYIRSYPPYWRSFLHPQPEEAPVIYCCLAYPEMHTVNLMPRGANRHCHCPRSLPKVSRAFRNACLMSELMQHYLTAHL